MTRWAATHQCPDCERTLRPFDSYSDVCPMCGQKVPNEERAAIHVAKVFAPDPVPAAQLAPAPLLRTSTAGKRKSRPGAGQGALNV